MGKLEGKVALVTGGNSGIGLATARRFVAEGAHVFITGRRQAELDEAVRQIGKHVTGVPGDVSNLADLDRPLATVKRQQGRLDVLFANAGFLALAPLGSISEEHFDKLFAINVKGLLFTVQQALPLFTDGASIILNASVCASQGLESASVYCASKAAVRSFAALLDHRAEAPQDPRERHQPRPDRNAWLQQARGDAGANRPVQGERDRRRAAGPDGHAGRGGERRRVPRLGRQQLRHRDRAVRRWRHGPGLSNR